MGWSFLTLSQLCIAVEDQKSVNMACSFSQSCVYCCFRPKVSEHGVFFLTIMYCCCRPKSQWTWHVLSHNYVLLLQARKSVNMACTFSQLCTVVANQTSMTREQPCQRNSFGGEESLSMQWSFHTVMCCEESRWTQNNLLRLISGEKQTEQRLLFRHDLLQISQSWW